MSVSDFPVHDADQHYYEPEDAFTRHIERTYRDRGVRVIHDGKRVVTLIGGRVNQFVPNLSFDPIIVPGCLDRYFRGEIPDDFDRSKLFQLEPIRPEYRDRDARATVLEAQGVKRTLLFPTFAVGVEQALVGDPEAAAACVRAFNRWLDEDWGFVYRDRLYAVPLISLAIPDQAEREVAWCAERGARMLHMRPGPVASEFGMRSPGDPLFDRVWAAIAEAQLPVAFHLGDGGYQRYAADYGEPVEMATFGPPRPLGEMVSGERAIHDTIASLVLGRLFERHPDLRVCSIENGSDWLFTLDRRLKKIANQHPEMFAESPADTLRRNVFTTPYAEEDVSGLCEHFGASQVLMGSDWPHGEGLAEPLDFADLLADLSEPERRCVLSTNLSALLHLDDVSEAT